MGPTASAPSAPGTQGGLYAHLRVGRCDIAVPVANVVEALAPPAAGLTPVPRRQGAIAGMLAVDGGVVPVVALDRWVDLGAADDAADPADARIVILRSGEARIGIGVDALHGVESIDAGAIRVACHRADAEELFDAVAPATAERPLLCVLEVDRLMALAATWCEAADLQRGAAPAERLWRRVPTTRYAVFAVGDALWAVAATAICRFEKTPGLEMRWDGRRVCGIGTWDGRKIPLVDLSAGGPGDPSRAWMAVLADGPLALGVVVSHFERMVGIAADEIAPVAGNDLLLGRAHVDGVGHVSVIAVDALFGAVPEATISRTRWETGRSEPTGVVPAAAAPGAEASHYLVFEADRSYATPAAGLLGVVALPAATIEVLASGRPSSIGWRGAKLGVVSLPSLDGGTPMTDPRIAVVVAGADGRRARTAIAVRSLTRWLSTRLARRSSMRLHGIGDVDVITPPGAQRGTSLVVVDLARMAFLLD